MEKGMIAFFLLQNVIFEVFSTNVLLHWADEILNPQM